jgi:hypothetical protein
MEAITETKEEVKEQITSLQARLTALLDAAKVYSHLYGPRVGKCADALKKAIKEAEGE